MTRRFASKRIWTSKTCPNGILEKIAGTKNLRLNLLVVMFSMLILSVSPALAINTQGKLFLEEFHSGRGIGSADSYVYARTMNFADISSIGDLIPRGQAQSDTSGSMDWTSLDRVLKNALRRGKILVLGLWVCNFETVAESGVRAFLARLNDRARNLNIYVIWIPAWEFNQHADWGHPEWNWGLGVAGSPRNWYIQADIYVSKMKMIRTARDSLGIKNVLIGAQPDTLFRYVYPNWIGERDPWPLTGQRVLMHYKAGIAQADVIGCSMYVGKGSTGDAGLTDITIIQSGFDWMHKVHDYIDLTKPFIAFEYNSLVQQSVSNANTFFIQNTYKQIPSNFGWGLRGINWWCPFVSASADAACNYWAEQYKGYNSGENTRKGTQVAFTLSPNPARRGQTVTLSGFLKDVSSNPVYPARVTVRYSTNGGSTWNTAWTLYTNTIGAFSKTFTFAGAGTYLLRVSYAGSATYMSSSRTVTLTVQ